jgi:hypothetical protein
MMWQTADISFIREFPWYSWVFYNKSKGPFPEDTVVLGRMLGTSEPEFELVMTSKLLKSNGEVVQHNTFLPLRQG